MITLAEAVNWWQARRDLKRERDSMRRRCVSMADFIQEQQAELVAQRDALAARDRIITEIRRTLGKVSTLEGIDGPIALLVSELARDHDELEARIEAVLTEQPVTVQDATAIDSLGELPAGQYLPVNRVHHLLRGGTRVPDYPPDYGG